MEAHVLELAVIAVVPGGGLWVPGKVAASLGATDGMEALSGGGGAGGDDVEGGTSPVRGHLTATTGRVGRGANCLQQLVFDGRSKGEREGAVAVVREKPVVSGAQRHAGGDEEGFMAGARNLEEDFLLALEGNLAVVGAARQDHQAIEMQQILRRELAVC